MPYLLRPRGAEILVNTETTGNQRISDVAALPGGGYVVTWTDSSGLGTDTSGSGVRAQLFDTLGNKVGVEFQVNSTLPGSQFNPSIVTLPSGRFVITWTDSSGLGGDSSSSAVKAQVFEANGTALGGEFLVNSVTAGSQALPQITELGNGGFVITWADGSNFSSSRSYDIKAQLFDGAGVRIGTEVLVNTTILGSQNQPGVVALSSGGFAIAWHDTAPNMPYDHSVRFQIYGPTGAPVGSEQVVMSNLGDISTPIVMAPAGTGFVAIWGVGDSTVGLDIKGQLFSASGAKIGAAFPVNSTTAGDQVAADVEALPGGGFLVTWQGPSGVGVETNVYGQVFNSGGSKVGTEFVLSSVTDGNQNRARVDVLTSGDVVVTWSDTSGIGGDSDSSAVKAQILTLASDPPSDINLSASAVERNRVRQQRRGVAERNRRDQYKLRLRDRLRFHRRRLPHPRRSPCRRRQSSPRLRDPAFGRVAYPRDGPERPFL